PDSCTNTSTGQAANPTARNTSSAPTPSTTRRNQQPSDEHRGCPTRGHQPHRRPEPHPPARTHPYYGEHARPRAQARGREDHPPSTLPEPEALRGLRTTNDHRKALERPKRRSAAI